MRTALVRALRPQSVAVIGASRNSGSIGRAVFDNLLGAGFEGPVFPINPKAAYIGSVRAYHFVGDAPGPIDLAVIALPADAVLGAVKECVESDVGAVLVISAGFSEIGGRGRELQNEIAAVVREHGIRLIGPNCLGVLNTDADIKLNATFSSQHARAGHAGLLSQSGAVGVVAIEAATKAGLGISTFVSVGNKADVSGNDLLEYWEHDDNTSIVMLYLESFGNPRQFSEIARRVARRKPIIAVKSGRSTAGLRAAASHTGAMATTDSAVDALFHHSGVIRVDTVEDMIDTALVLDRRLLPTGNRVAIVGNSGGPGIMAADVCETAGLKLAQLSGVTKQRLCTVLPQMPNPGNPLDLLAGARAADYEAALNAVLADDAVDVAVVIFTRTLPGGGRAVAQAVEEVSAMYPGKAVVACFLGTDTTVTTTGLPCFGSVERAVLALGRVVRYADWRWRPEGSVPRIEIDRVAVQEVVDHGSGWLGADDASKLLHAYGIPTVTSVVVNDADEAVLAAESLGVPVVVKSAAPGLVHKTDVGAVHVDLRTSQDVSDAVAACRVAVGDVASPVLVQPMIRDGVEVIVGVTHDDRFGPLVMFGLGGIATELLADRAFRSTPMTDTEAASLVREIRGHPLLFGYRGAQPVDVDALEDLLLRVAQLGQNVPQLAEMDLNPVMVTPQGALVVDAKIRLTERPA